MRALLITGSRDFTDERPVREAIERVKPDLVVHGASRGADSIADRVALALKIHVEAHAAEWERLGKGAGPARNQRMLDRLLALRVEGWTISATTFPLPGSRGTWNMVRRLRWAGVEVEVVE